MAGAGVPVRVRPGLGDLAPDFAARSTRGPLRLSDRRGRWIVLFTHPADFTPVCTSEFVALAAAKPEFDAIGCDIIAHSVDSLSAHLAWIRSIEAHTGQRISFPVVEDVGLSIARAYGMIHDGSTTTATVRGVFAIDPEGIIQAIQFYPMTVGRSISELLRLVRALQAVQDGAVCAPADWVPGTPMLELVDVTDLDRDDGEGQSSDAAPDRAKTGDNPWYMKWVGR